MRRARCHFRLRDYYQVSSDTGKVLKIDKNNIEAYLLRGHGYYQLAEHEMAKKHYAECLRSDPEHRDCKKANTKLTKIMRFVKRADAAQQEGRFLEAVEDYAAAVKVDPEHLTFNQATQLSICTCYNKVGRRRVVHFARRRSHCLPLPLPLPPPPPIHNTTSQPTTQQSHTTATFPPFHKLSSCFFVCEPKK
jgi:tetratricopeptide (TPR) repeat protein